MSSLGEILELQRQLVIVLHNYRIKRISKEFCEEIFKHERVCSAGFISDSIVPEQIGCLWVGVESYNQESRDRISSSYCGIRVYVEVTGKIVAY